MTRVRVAQGRRTCRLNEALSVPSLLFFEGVSGALSSHGGVLYTHRSKRSVECRTTIPGNPVRSTHSRRSKVKRCPPPPKIYRQLIIELVGSTQTKHTGTEKKRTSCSPMWVCGPDGPRRANKITYKAPGAPRILPHAPKHSPSPLPQPKYCKHGMTLKATADHPC